MLNIFVTVLLACAPLDSKPIAPDLLVDARWVEGRVAIPAGTPADERVEVVAHATGLPKFNDHTAQLDNERRFKIAFAKDARRGRVQLQGRYLYLAAHPSWHAKDEPRALVLEPHLGAWLTGRIASPRADARLGGIDIVLTGLPLGPAPNLLERRLRTQADGSFELGGLPCDHNWSATVTTTGHQPLHVESIALEPGKRANVTWTLRRGATLTGHVVHERNGPIAGARLTFDCRSDPLAPLAPEIATGLQTGADGAFTAPGLYPGDVLVRVERAGYVPLAIELRALIEGEVRADVALVLQRGQVLKGLVLDQRGAPVAGAWLEIEQTVPGFGTSTQRMIAARDGSYSFAGLTGHVKLRAGVDEPRRVLRAGWSSVELGSRGGDHLVYLAERHTLKGRLLDDLGRTILRYTAGVKRIDPADPNPKPRTIDVNEKDGVFAIGDLDAGPWEVFVYGRGLVFEPARRIEVPHAADDIVFVVRRPAVVAGRVVNADGTPAARALVELEWDRPAMFGGGSMKEQTSVTTSHEGFFELTEIYPGSVRVVATTEDGRKSETSTLELVSGEKRAALSLRITR